MRFGCNVLDMLSWHASVMATSVWKMFLKQTYHKSQRKKAYYRRIFQTCSLNRKSTVVLSTTGSYAPLGWRWWNRLAAKVALEKASIKLFQWLSTREPSWFLGSHHLQVTQMNLELPKWKKLFKGKNRWNSNDKPKEIGWVNEQMTLDRLDDAEKGMCTSYK